MFVYILENYCIPGGIRGNYESHSQKVMKNHNKKVLSPRIHENRGIERMHIESTLDEIQKFYIIRHNHTKRPVLE